MEPQQKIEAALGGGGGVTAEDVREEALRHPEKFVVEGDQVRLRDDAETASAPESGRWEFDETVTAAFDDMLEKSIPNYADMRRIVTDASCWLLDSARHRKPARLVDLGASRGTQLQPILDRMGAHARYDLCEFSDPMLEALIERYRDWGTPSPGIVSVVKADLRQGWPTVVKPADVVLSVLTLQFIPIEYRQNLLRGIYENLRPGGGLILVEKVLGEADETNRLLVDLYYGLKRENGYTQEAIDRKRLSLEGVLVPLTADFNEALLRRAGFDLVEVVWAWCQFRGWLAVKR